jgi:multiple sugar transport system permease protein
MSASTGTRPRVWPGRGASQRAGARRRSRTGQAFVAPAIITLLAVLGFPIVVAVANSFLSPDGGVTLDNYGRLGTDPNFLNSLRVSFVFVGGTVALHLVLGMAVALALDTQIRGRQLWRVLMILPWTLPDVISGLVWRFMYNPTSGIINHVARRTGLAASYIDWLGNPDLALPSVILADVWRGYPFVMIILLAGLQSTSSELSEAARVDGARWWQEFWYVTLPQLRRIIVVAIALDAIWQFRRFGLVYNMTLGGPGRLTEILSLNIYKTYFDFFEYEYASAMAAVLAIVMVVLTIPYVRDAVRDRR